MHYTHLTEDERYHIDELLREGYIQSDIAKSLGRSASTLSREFSRNTGKCGWRPRQAEGKAIERLTKRGTTNVRKVNELSWGYVIEKLTEEQWSPEQIAGRMKLDKVETISHETIYQHILSDKLSDGTLYTHLRCQKQRKKRYGSKTAGRGCIPNRVDIENRPAIVDSRKRVGDWEGDTIIGCHKGGAVIASMVERKSRYTVLVKSPDKTTVSVIGGIVNKMKTFSKVIKTITFDNGKEFSSHAFLTKHLGAEIYFARPYHSWERGLNENTNGLVRQYFPKKTSFDRIEEKEFQKVADKLNSRPRKCLGYKTPFEVFKGLSITLCK